MIHAIFFRLTSRMSGVVVLWLLAHVAHAQHDVILRTDGQEINARVLTIAPDAIQYLPLDSAATDTLQLRAADVFLIRYATGAREVIRPAVAAPVGLTPLQAHARGILDARRYYQPKGVFWGTYGATMLTPIAGVVTGAVLSIRKPGTATFVVPDTELLRNPDYMRSYQNQAQRKRIGKAAAGFGAGVGTFLVLASVLSVALLH